MRVTLEQLNTLTGIAEKLTADECDMATKVIDSSVTHAYNSGYNIGILSCGITCLVGYIGCRLMDHFSEKKSSN